MALVDLDVDVFGGGVEGHVVYRVNRNKDAFFFFFFFFFFNGIESTLSSERTVERRISLFMQPLGSATVGGAQCGGMCQGINIELLGIKQ